MNKKVTSLAPRFAHEARVSRIFLVTRSRKEKDSCFSGLEGFGGEERQGPVKSSMREKRAFGRERAW